MTPSDGDTVNSRERLFGDRPILSEAEDRLGLTAFADALARSLTEMAPDEGLVISVEGEWGSGKTSAIELTQRRLILRELAREVGISIPEIEKREWASVEADWKSRIETRRTHIVRFNPWNFSGQENLVRAFFTEVGAIIGHPPTGPIARAIKKVTDHLPSAGLLIGSGVGAAAGGLAGAGVVARIGRAIGEGVQRYFGASGSLENAKRELAEALRQASKRIVIIIDDLDRLLPSEMRAMLSLVKSLGDLPNVLYVLSFDQKIVMDALRNGPEPIDPEFLEKIVQVPLKLPPPWQPEIRQLFLDRLNSIIGDVAPNDTGRWHHVFFEAIAPYLKTPRDVTRICNTLQVIWPNVKGDVDLTDLLALTTLQLFEAPIYQSIFDNIDALAGEAISFEDDKVFAARFDLKAANNPSAAKKSLIHLFPKLAKGWNEHTLDGTPYIKKREQRRLCTREYYRNYFLFGRDPDRVSREEIESALQDINPTPRLNELIARLAQKKSRRGASRVAAFLDQVFEIVFSKPLLSDALVRAILDLSDDLIKREDQVWEFFISDNLERLESVLIFGLEPLSKTERENRVRLISKHSNGLTLAATVIDHLAGQHGRHGQQAKFENERMVSSELLDEVVPSVLERLRVAARSATLLSTPLPTRLIWLWKRWTGPEEVGSWLSEQMKSDDAILRLAEILPSTSYQSSSEGQRVIRSFKSKDYEDILNIHQFRTRLEAIARRDGSGSSAEQIFAEFSEAEATRTRP